MLKEFSAPFMAFYAQTRYLLTYFQIGLGLICLLSDTQLSQAQSNTDRLYITIETALGTIEAEIYPKQAPLTAANFVKYMDAGFYNGGLFHRTVTMNNQPDNQVKIEVIQAQIQPGKMNQQFPPIPLERTSQTGLRHDDGTLSMARLGPDTATSDFFICIGKQPSLDDGGKRNPDGQGFAAFGKVITGMDIVKKIQNSGADGQKLQPAVGIIHMQRKPSR